MRIISSLALGAFVLLGCTSHDSSSAAGDDVAFIDGFHPVAPRDNEVRVVAPLVENVPAGGDVTWCTYIANPFDREVDVVQSRGFQSKFGHHVLLMDVPGAEARLGQSHVCNSTEMTNARFLAGGSDAAPQFQIPEGIAFRIRAQSVLMVQSHWINTSDKPIQGQAAFNIGVKPPDGSRQSAQLFAMFTPKVSLPPRGPAKAQSECTMDKDVQFFAFGGHAHEWGKHVRISVDRGSMSEMLYDRDWQPEFQSDPQFNAYDIKAPLVLHKGDKLHLDCDYANTTDAEIHFPREMCVALGFFFPGTSGMQCMDGKWLTGNEGMP